MRTQACTETYGFSAEVVCTGNLRAAIPYIPVHVDYMCARSKPMCLSMDVVGRENSTKVSWLRQDAMLVTLSSGQCSSPDSEGTQYTTSSAGSRGRALATGLTGRVGALRLFELLKNAMRAVAEAHRGRRGQPLPPIVVRICEAPRSVTLRISDQACTSSLTYLS